jgi:hypothetical protein
MTPKSGNLLDTPCRQCGQPLGPEVFFGTEVCRRCCRRNHREVLGKAKSKPKTTNTRK